MRILHITPHYYPTTGGAETYTKELSERLARRGHDVTVLTTRNGDGEDVTGAKILNGVKIQRFRPSARLQYLVGGILSTRVAQALAGLALSEEKINLVATNTYGLRPFQSSVGLKPDLVAVINWYDGSLAYQACLARRMRDFVLVGLPLFHIECTWSRQAVYKEMLTRCDAVLALTEYEKEFIEERSSEGKAHVVGAGVDPSVFADADGREIRARYHIGDAPLVGYVGRMDPSKGVVTLIEAMKAVWRNDTTVRLLLAGSGLPPSFNGHPQIPQAFAGLSDTERARIIGIGSLSDREKPSVFAALDVFAMPSPAESFGIGYLEAWASKKAVIGARIGSTRCVIDDGVDGLLVAPHDSGDLAEAIRRLLRDRVAREEMGRAGYSKVMTRFTWDNIADKVEHIYKSAHARKDKVADRVSGGVA